MFHVESYQGTREENYESVIRQLQALLDGETDRIADIYVIKLCQCNMIGPTKLYWHTGRLLTQGKTVSLDPLEVRYV